MMQYSQQQCNKDHSAVYIVKFMHPSGPSRSFFWPQQEDTCWVPLKHFLCVIDAPFLLLPMASTKYPTNVDKQSTTNGLTFTQNVKYEKCCMFYNYYCDCYEN